MARCPTCRHAVEELATIATAVRGVPRRMPAPDVVARTKAAVAASLPAPRPSPQRTGWLLESWQQLHVVAAAAVAAGMICAALLHANGAVAAVLGPLARIDASQVLLGRTAQPGHPLPLPVGEILLLGALLFVPSMIENVLGLAMHRAALRPWRRRDAGRVFRKSMRL